MSAEVLCKSLNFKDILMKVEQYDIVLL